MSLALEHKRALGRFLESKWENLSQKDKEYWQKHDDYRERINAILNRFDPSPEGMVFCILHIINDGNGGCDKVGVSAIADMLVERNRDLRKHVERRSHAKWLCEHLLEDLKK